MRLVTVSLAVISCKNFAARCDMYKGEVWVEERQGDIPST